MRDDPQAVGFEDHNRLVVADAGGEAIDPVLIFLDAGGPTSRELGTVAEWYVVRHQDRKPVLCIGILHSLLHVLLDPLRSAAGEPDCLWRLDHLADEPGIRKIMLREETSDLLNRTAV